MSSRHAIAGRRSKKRHDLGNRGVRHGLDRSLHVGRWNLFDAFVGFGRATLAIAFGGLVAGPIIDDAAAQTCDPYFYTLTNGTTANADHVMGNFNLVRDCANTLASGGTLTNTTLSGNPTVTGQLGIGTSTPSAELDVQGGRANISSGNPGAVVADPTGDDLVVSGSGQSGISILTSDSIAGNIYFGSPSNNVNMRVYAKHNAGSPFLEIEGGGGFTHFSSSGAVGIGTATPQAKLDVNGGAVKPGGGSWGTSSDRRLKKNIVPLTDALEKLTQLEGVQFEWRNPKEHELGLQAGLIAQDVEAVFPDWVFEADAKGADAALVGAEARTKILSFPHDFNAYLIEAIKELKARNLSLLERLGTLEARFQEQGDIIERLAATGRQQAAGLARLRHEVDALRGKANFTTAAAD